ncbi:MAG: hypothetical protein ACREO3_04150 [Arenimonas sp.]
MIDRADTRAIDLLLAVPASALTALLALVVFGLVFSPDGARLGLQDLHIVAGLFGAVLLPIALLATIPGYLLLRTLDYLGAIPCGFVGLLVGMIVMVVLLPSNGSMARITVVSASIVAGLGGYAALAWLANRRKARRGTP